MIAIKLNAGNDRNGNGRRVYIVLNEEGIVGAVNEESRGWAALADKYPSVQCVAEFDTSVKEYRDLVKWQSLQDKVKRGNMA